MRPILRRLALLPALLLAPAVLAADPPADPPATAPQSSEQEDGDSIVVTGQSQTIDRREVTRQARAISRATDLRHEPLARFSDRACPGVAGLKLEFAELFVARIRMIAEDLSIPLAPEGKCTPNIIVVFTDDGRADLAEIQRRTGALSDVLTVRERRELLEEPGPVRVWSVVERRMQNGTPIPPRRDLVNPPVGQMEGGQSRISTATTQDIVGVMVLFDRDDVRDRTLHQLADYTVMRVFARTRDAKGEDAPDTILALFDEGNPAPADGLTEFDRAYLASLYEGTAHIKGISKLLRVGRNLEKLRQAEE